MCTCGILFLSLSIKNIGIDSATSQYSCIWCKCSSKERHDVQKKWSLTDPTKGARTTEENFTLSTSARSKKKFNVSNPPIFPFIRLQNIVIDNLHLFLRVSDVLIDLLIMELKRQDALDKVRTFNSFYIRKYDHIARYVLPDLVYQDFNFMLAEPQTS